MEEARPRNRAVDDAFLVLERDTEAGGGVLAAAVAFRIFLLAVPYVFSLCVAFGLADAVADDSPGTAAKKAGIGGLLVQAVSSSTHLSGFARVSGLIGGIVFTIVTARTLLKALRIVHGLVWRVPVAKPARPVLSVLILLAITTVGFVLVVVIGHLGLATPLATLAAILLVITIPAGIWLVVSSAMPHARGAGWKDMIPGSILFGVACLGLHLFTVLWIVRSAQHKSETYGTIGTALTVLLWAYVLGRIMTASAMLNAAVWKSAHPDASASMAQILEIGRRPDVSGNLNLGSRCSLLLRDSAWRSGIAWCPAEVANRDLFSDRNSWTRG